MMSISTYFKANRSEFYKLCNHPDADTLETILCNLEQNGVVDITKDETWNTLSHFIDMLCNSGQWG